MFLIFARLVVAGGDVMDDLGVFWDGGVVGGGLGGLRYLDEIEVILSLYRYILYKKGFYFHKHTSQHSLTRGINLTNSHPTAT